jgi:hypothetical protein
MCDYVVNDKPRYNPDASIMEARRRATAPKRVARLMCLRHPQAVTELLHCRLTLKNFAWNEHWLMFLTNGFLKEV